MSEKTTLRSRDYHQTIVRGPDPVTVTAALAGSGRLSGYVAYEREGRIHLGANPIGSVTVDRDHIRSTLGGESTQAWSGTSWPLVGAALEHAPVRGWRAYGWACFELAHQPAASHDVLAHVMIPGIEFDICDDAVLIRTCESTDERRSECRTVRGKRSAPSWLSTARRRPSPTCAGSSSIADWPPSNSLT
nr:hypothetical protein [Nocardia amamiensis]